LLDEEGLVWAHPSVVGELVLGGLSTTEERLLQYLPMMTSVPYEEMLEFIRHRRLARRGIGWVDANLLASALASSAVLWTLDSRLADAAKDLNAAFVP
jgi:predicted nucleic acid-binding protein